MSDHVVASPPTTTTTQLVPNGVANELEQYTAQLENILNEDVEYLKEIPQAGALDVGTTSHVVIHENPYDGGPKLSLPSPLKSMLKKTSKPKLTMSFINESGSHESLVSVMSMGGFSHSTLNFRDHDFFEKFGELPTLDQVALMDDSDDDEEDETLLKMPSTVLSVSTEKGNFVDPVTSDPTHEDDESDDEEGGDKLVEVESMDGDEEEEQSEQDDELEDVYAMQFEEETRDTQREELLEALFQRALAPNVVIKEGDIAISDRRQYEYELQTITEQFMKGMINAVVEHCETYDRNFMLRRNLDKMHLAEDIVAAIFELQTAQKSRLFLNRKGTEFFHRRRTFRPISADHPDTVGSDIVKFKAALQNLDLLLGREQESRATIEGQVANLKAEVAQLEAQAEDTIKQFEDLVRNTLTRETDKGDRLKMVVEYMLRKKAGLRKEITKLRLVLIQRQHTFATLQKRWEMLEDLGYGLHMTDFETLHTETQALGKKIEERNIELNKLRQRTNADLHVRAHIRERHQMLRHWIVVQKSALQELIEEKNVDRAYLYELKLERAKIRASIRENSFQSGLIDKPELMIDYDQTLEKLEKTRGRVEMLRQKLSDAHARASILQHRISTMY